MSADDVIALPVAFSGQRLDWRDLPRHVRTRIAELAGAQVTAEISATSGFSPGFAAVLELADGRGVFVKAVSSAENPLSPDLARAEARVAASIRNDNVVSIYAVREIAGVTYLAMEYVRGSCLETRVEQHGPMPVLLAVSAVRQVGAGLAALPSWLVAAEVSRGALRPVLGEWRTPESGVFAVYPSNRLIAGKVKVFVDRLARQLKRVGG